MQVATFSPLLFLSLTVQLLFRFEILPHVLFDPSRVETQDTSLNLGFALRSTSLFTMDSSDDDSSLHLFNENTELNPRANEEVVVVNGDESREEDDCLSDQSSLAALTLDDASPVIKPKAYQLEMLEESLKRNIIVAVSHPKFGGLVTN